MSSPSHAIHAKETAFHDDWAAATPVEQVRVRECFEAPTALENRYILSRMGPLACKRVLDIGSGLGESSVYFALRGATVTMVDISPGNQDRYWKRILNETDATLVWWKPLAGLDSVLTRIPGLRWWAWNVVLSGRKQ